MRRNVTLPVLSLFVVTLVAASTALAAPSASDLRKCQKQLGKQTLAISKFISRQVHTCTEKIAKCELAAEIDGVDGTNCLEKVVARCARVVEKRTVLATKLREKALKKCEGILPSDVEPYVGGLGFLNQVGECATLPPPLTPVTVTTLGDLVDCLSSAAFCAAESDVVRRDPRAPAALTTAGLSGVFPCAAP